jgi:hypothetical protein
LSRTGVRVVCFFATLEGNISLAQFPEARFWIASG